jgi:stress response protein SCP2
MAETGQRSEAVNWDLEWSDFATDVPPLPAAARTPPAPSPEPARAPSPPPVQQATASTRLLVRGQRVKLGELLPGAAPAPFEVTLQLASTSGQVMDFCCFGLDGQDKLSDDRYFIFFNQLASPEGALTTHGAHNEKFGVDLGRLPGTVRKLVFTASFDGAGSMSALGASHLDLRAADGRVVARYAFTGSDLDDVRALMVAEIYFKDVWRLGAVGQGFNGGLSALLKHFGGEEA